MQTFQLQELVDRIENNYDPEEVELIVDKADFDLNESSIYITIKFEEGPIEKWRISMDGYLHSEIVFKTPACSISLKEDDPLSWEYKDWQADLYFTGDTQMPYELIWDLISINKSLFDPYGPLFKYFNGVWELDHLVTVKAGLLAKGPKKLLLEYAACLDKYGMQYSITNGYQPTAWDGEKRIVSKNKAMILFIGRSYIIADQFHLFKV